jgi:putative CocE/NonD family hydrolase
LYFENNDYNDFWRQPGLGMDEYFDRFPDMPILWITSWFDWYPRTISDGYQAMVGRGRKDQYLIIGPWTHWNFRYAVGDVNFPNQGNQGGGLASRDAFLDFELAWFDRYVKKDAGADPPGPPVQYYEMGGGDGRRGPGGRLNHGGQWRRADAWPPKTVRPTQYYLHAGGELSTAAPAEKPSSSSYVYDPDNTVSSNGRCIVSYGPSAGKSFAGMGPQDQIQFPTLPGHGTPGQPIVERDDVLAFQTAPLQQDVVVAGNIRVTLWVSSDAPDTDFYVKLVDVHPPNDDYPRGYGFPVSEGILRARYRDGFQNPVLMKPGQKYRLLFPLEPAANRFLANHRIQIYVCSSNFPNFDINRNTGDPASHEVRVARNTVHHDAWYPSAIELPVHGVKPGTR